MIFHQLFVSLLLSTIASAAYSASGHNVAAYWGQGAGQSALGEYCSQGNMDIVILSFLNAFGTSTMAYNFGNSDLTKTATDIKTCQDKGIKVLLSLGGAIGSYGVSDSSMATAVANDLYTQFGPKGTVFSGATIDGFDLDIEAGAAAGYPALVSAIKSKFGKGTLVTAAPQCVYPDAYLGDALKESDIDIAFVQFYNNNCNLIGNNYNWDTWVKELTNSFKNKDMKLYIGLPGSSVAAGSGYADAATVKSKSASALSSSHFGGFMVWDASYASKNNNFLGQLKSILGTSSDNNNADSTSNTASLSETNTAAPAASGASTDSTTTLTAAATTVKVTTTVSKSSAGGFTSSSTLSTVIATTASATLDYQSEPSLMTNISWAVTSPVSLMTDVLWAVTVSK